MEVEQWFQNNTGKNKIYIHYELKTHENLVK